MNLLAALLGVIPLAFILAALYVAYTVLTGVAGQMP
jgi:hypothetical protein